MQNVSERDQIGYAIENYYDFKNLSEKDARDHLNDGLRGLDSFKEVTELGYMEAKIVYDELIRSIRNCGLTEDEKKCLFEIYVLRRTQKEAAKVIGRSSYYVFTSSKAAFEKLFNYVRCND